MHLYRRLIALTLLVLLLAPFASACGKANPPCPKNNLEVYLQEADSAMTRKAKRLEQEGKLDSSGRAITFNCGYDKLPDGSYRKADQQQLGWRDVLWCIETMVEPKGIPLLQCLEAAARSAFTGKLLGGDQAVETMVQIASKVTCLEFSREVDIEAEKHGLQRTGPGWVEITIFAVIQIVEAGMAPVTAPAMFLIKPGQGGAEEACVEVPADPPKKCAAQGDCPEQPPGATPVPSGTSSGAGGVIPPGTTPGDPGSSGDYP